MIDTSLFGAEAAELDEWTLMVCAEGDVEELARAHVALKTYLDAVRLCARTIEERLAEVMPDKTLELDGLPVLERGRAKNRKDWQSEQLFDRVVQYAADPEGTGELPPPVTLIENITWALKKALPLTGSLGWRVKALEDLGFDVDEWCSTSPGRVSVRIHGGDQ